nr:hypothetical protein [Oceanisphaera psychrotolerans]
MNEVKDLKGWIMPWLNAHVPQFSGLAYTAAVLLLIVLISAAIHFVLHRVVLKWVEGRARGSRRVWRQAFFERKLFNRLALTLQGIIIYIQAGLWLDGGACRYPLFRRHHTCGYCSMVCCRCMRCSMPCWIFFSSSRPCAPFRCGGSSRA